MLAIAILTLIVSLATLVSVFALHRATGRRGRIVVAVEGEEEVRHLVLGAFVRDGPTPLSSYGPWVRISAIDIGRTAWIVDHYTITSGAGSVDLRPEADGSTELVVHKPWLTGQIGTRVRVSVVTRDGSTFKTKPIDLK